MTARVVVRRAWLQKHPTPDAAAGEFHWYPGHSDRELRGELVERVRGVEPPGVLWSLAPDRAVWARAFAAHAPTDGRRYIGLAVAIAEAGEPTSGSERARPATLLAAIRAPEPMPWYPTGAHDAVGEPRTIDTARLPVRHRARVGVLREIEAVTSRELDRRDAIAIARSLIAGGVARIADPAAVGVLAAVAGLEAVMPPVVARLSRRGSCVVASRGDELATPDPIASLAVAAWLEPATPRARAWRLLGDLAGARGATLHDVALSAGDVRASLAVRSTPNPARGVLTDAETAAIGSPGPSIDIENAALVDILHAWGRGRFDRCPTAGTLVERLADAVALRALAALVDGHDAGEAIAEARWHSILPAARRDALLDTLVRRAGSLRDVVEVSHG